MSKPVTMEDFMGFGNYKGSSPEPTPELSNSGNKSVIYSDMDDDFQSTNNGGVDPYENQRRKLKNIKYKSKSSRNTYEEDKNKHNDIMSNGKKIKHYYKAKHNNKELYEMNENKIKKSKKKQKQSKNEYNKLSRKEQRELRDAFKLFDKDDDGTITIQELYSVFLGLNYNFTKLQIKKMISCVLDNEGDYKNINEKNCKLDINEFVMIMKGHKYDDVDNRKSYIEELKEAFDVFDKDGDGNITPNELSSIMKALGEDLNEKEILSMINEVDEDNNGTIDFDEFQKLMMSDFGNNDDVFMFKVNKNKKLKKINDNEMDNNYDNDNIANQINNNNNKSNVKYIKYDQL